MLRRYPNPTADAFRVVAAKLFGVTPDMIIAGNGSDDILTIASRTVISDGGKLAVPDPSYSLYPVLAHLQDASVVRIPWLANYTLPTEALVNSGAQAIYLPNPNAPTGTFVPAEQISELAARFQGLVLVDEAYVDFADTNCVSLVHKHDNVLVSRTLSKAYSLAGLRFGFAIGPVKIIDEMMKVKDSYNCDAIAIAAATAALEDQAYARNTWDHVRSERTRLTAELTSLGWAVIPSAANFVLATPPGGRGRDIYKGLKQQGILVRYFDAPGLNDKVRITIGTSQENNALLAGIRQILSTDQPG
jgi:histidinol-phosphate aminotransferase